MKLALFAAVVLRLWHTDPQDLQELATVTRSIADIREVPVNAAEPSIAFNGTPQQNSIAEWLVLRLDFRGQRPAETPYQVGADDVVRVLYLNNAASAQQAMEIVTVVRTLAEAPRAFVYQPARAIVVRGTAEQTALAEWLVAQLDLTKAQAKAAPLHRVGGKADDIARVFYLNHTQSIQEVQEMVTAIRTIGEIRRAFTYATAKAVAMRGTTEQMALAEFLVDRLNQPPGGFSPGSNGHQMVGSSDGVVRLFAIQASSTAELQQSATDIRAATGIRRAFTYSPHRALILRGTPEQIAQAALLANR
jgi:predicted oxidoreductase (fatty acid repression mutant protein)